jgi:hypothetical protein
MTSLKLLSSFLLTLLAFASTAIADDEKTRLAGLDAFWAEVSRSVREGDFDAYQATCHSEGILVSGSAKKCYPLAKALAGWKQDFVDTAAGKTKASVEFRFSQRLGDETTAHETGIFVYSSATADGEPKKEYVHFECLLSNKDGWKTVMEYQKSKATKAEWEALR